MAIPVLLSVLVLLPSGVFAATLPRETDLMRREQSKPLRHAAHLTSSGEIHHVRHNSHKTDHSQHHVKKKHHGHKHHHSHKGASALETKDCSDNLCNITFSMGADGSNDCAEANHTVILNKATCIFAATMAHAGTDPAVMTEKPEWEDKFPQGCFKYSCSTSESANGICYFYNSVGNASVTGISGNKICTRPRYLRSTVPDSNGGCPGGYQVIDDEDTCREAAQVGGVTAGTHIIVGVQNASKKLDHPRGCFIDNDDGKVYWNHDGDGAEEHVKGLLLCNISWGPSFPIGTGLHADAATAAAAVVGAAPTPAPAPTPAAAPTPAPATDATPAPATDATPAPATDATPAPATDATPAPASS